MDGGNKFDSLRRPAVLVTFSLSAISVGKNTLLFFLLYHPPTHSPYAVPPHFSNRIDME